MTDKEITRLLTQLTPAQLRKIRGMIDAEIKTRAVKKSGLILRVRYEPTPKTELEVWQRAKKGTSIPSY